MCKHEYEKLGYLSVSKRRGYDQAFYTEVCGRISVHQCLKCGEVILQPDDLWKTLLNEVS